MAIETPELPISPRNPQFPSPNEAQASDQNPNALNSETEEELDGSTTVKEIAQSQPFHLNSRYADPEQNSRIKELQLEKELLILKLKVLEREGNQELAMKGLEKEMLILKHEDDERQMNHDREMLELKNQQGSEKLQSTHNHQMAMKIETLKMTELKIEADEKRRHEEQQQQLNKERYLLTTTILGTGAAAGAGAVLGSACALGAAVGAAAVTAPIAIPIALVSGISFIKRKSKATSSP